MPPWWEQPRGESRGIPERWLQALALAADTSPCFRENHVAVRIIVSREEEIPPAFQWRLDRFDGDANRWEDGATDRSVRVSRRQRVCVFSRMEMPLTLAVPHPG